MSNNSTYKALGVMSGSSLDGLDLCLVEFNLTDTVAFRIIRTKNIEYPNEVRSRLLGVMQESALHLARTHVWLGNFIGEACKKFLQGEPIDLIASHGHTIFHKPEEGLTTQIGCGAHIAGMSGTPAVCDFRTLDVALGGQGAPLVPFGEQALFPEFDGFLNLGGIANISVHRSDHVIGFDICPCAQVLDMLAQRTGHPYDKNGVMASSGKILPELMEKAQALPFYSFIPPRSLGREWFNEVLKPLLNNADHSNADLMRTMVEHIALQISTQANSTGIKVLLVTGGGAHNEFLLSRITALCNAKVSVPEMELVEYKEALIFAYLGLRRWLGEVNVLASVTGASRDSCGAAVYLP